MKELAQNPPPERLVYESSHGAYLANARKLLKYSSLRGCFLGFCQRVCFVLRRCTGMSQTRLPADILDNDGGDCQFVAECGNSYVAVPASTRLGDF